MSSKVFLQALQNKLKGGNSRSIHLNALPGRLATRLDLKQLDLIEEKLSLKFLQTILTKASFEFKITFDKIDLNTVAQDSQKRLGVISKRLNSIIIENEVYFKDHGTKTLGFGYPILIKRSSKDPAKIIKAPLFIWPLDAIKSRNKVNEWSILRNKSVQADGSFMDDDIHSVSINEVLLSFIKGENDIVLPDFSAEALEDSIIDPNELLQQCALILNALNPGSVEEHLSQLKRNVASPINILPEATEIDSIANNKAYIHFGGVFGLFRAQKESIITDITRLIERFDEFEFENLKVENLSITPFSAVNTDPTQQAIINALGVETNQIIQGPPGTGKSQSLTALITNAVANGLKCLVVCEKKTALDIIRRNIEKTNAQMAGLVAVIDDVNEDREAIIDSVRDRQNSLPNHLYVERAKSKYLSASEKLKEITDTINFQHAALAQPIYNGLTWDQIVGRYLHLRKAYTELPLKSALNIAHFKLRENESELKHILNYLHKADGLYHQSLSYNGIFSSLSDDFLRNKTTGEARIKLEEFITNLNFQIPLLEKAIRNTSAESQDWLNTVYEEMPVAFKKEFDPYLPFISGTKITKVDLPKRFDLEQLLIDFVNDLLQLLKDAKLIKEDYNNDLSQHYNGYHEQLNIELKSYLEFVNDNINLHGKDFMNNSSTARFKTNLFSLFSSKYKVIKQSRREVKSRVENVRIAHQKKAYIPHQYNDNVESADLYHYLNNVVDLKRKADDWSFSIPSDIEKYTGKINNLNCHPEFAEIKQRANDLLKHYSTLSEIFKLKYCLIQEDNVSELNQLIDCIPGLLLDLNDHQQNFQKFRDRYTKQNEEYIKILKGFSDIDSFNNKVCVALFNSFNDLSGALTECTSATVLAKRFGENMFGFRLYHDWRTYYLSLNVLSRQLIDIVAANLNQFWENGFECWYLFWILSLHEPPNLPKNDLELQSFKRLKSEFDTSQLENVMAQWTERQAESVKAFRAKGQVINSLFNKKGAKGMRRNSLRTIIKREFDLFTDFFPVVLLNPSVCSSAIPLEEGIFDLVIFDEASQLRLEDTYASLIRGKAKIVSGDKHQMAPSSYFEVSGALLNPFDGDDDNDDEEEEGDLSLQRSDLNLADAESLLAFAVDRNFKESYLSVHYRSRHPYLIDFSNHAFYGKRLIPVPASREYTPIEFIQVDGTYEGGTNKKEALQVISILRDKIRPLADGSLPSVGIATFNMYQRNLILEEIAEARRSSAEFDLMMGKLGSSFFVKNLENIQGDERDVIIISSTFGRKLNGSFSQNFGPIIQSKGHRMLNVIITRAKDKVYVCNSIPVEYVSQYVQLTQEKGNKGRAVLYAYLTYAKAVTDGNEALRANLLNLLSQYCIDQLYERNEFGIGSESVFEDEVFSRLAQHIGINRIQQQYPVGGFRIDMVIHPKHAGGIKIALECDGAKYHNSAEAYAWDIFRQEQLEKFGFVFYRIWSTKWWDSSERELESLLEFIFKNDSQLQ